MNDRYTGQYAFKPNWRQRLDDHLDDKRKHNFNKSQAIPYKSVYVYSFKDNTLMLLSDKSLNIRTCSPPSSGGLSSWQNR